jgi:DMSO/TMAO reductase YedYZ molybdopterin-dependent catalytic subunit
MDKPDISRRGLLKGGAALAGVSVLQVSGLAEAFAKSDDKVLPWVDQPPPDTIDNLHPWEELVQSWITPRDRFFNVNHFGQPTSLDENTWHVIIAGLVRHRQSLTIADLRARERRELDFTIECSGDNGFPDFSSAVGNAHWAGTPLAPVLRDAGILEDGKEVVFYGVDRGKVTIRDNIGILRPGKTGKVTDDGEGGLDLTITEQFARSMSVEDALHPDNLLCYEMNGEPLPPEHGFPVRLIAPGWFGVANVKWLTRIEVRDQRYAGKVMARDYVSIREEHRGNRTLWTFSTVGPIRLKSAPGHVARRANGRYVIRGAAWGAPIAAVEVQIDNGPWRAARIDRPDTFVDQNDNATIAGEDSFGSSGHHRSGRRGYSWRFWELHWGSPAPGEHTVRSRAFDTDGNMQPAPDDPYLLSKVTYWESNGQITRKVRIPD